MEPVSVTEVKRGGGGGVSNYDNRGIFLLLVNETVQLL